MIKKILVLGNSPHINTIDFNRLDPKIKTIGVNRIWLKHLPDYYFFHDADILTELESNHIIRSKLVSNSQCISSDWIRHSAKYIPNWLKIYNRENRRAFPDSISTSIRILNTILPGKKSDYCFYLAGVDLKWNNPSHFWKEIEYASVNNKDESWYSPRFDKMFENLRDLKSHGFNIVSVNPNSNINKLFRYENIENLYSMF